MIAHFLETVGVPPALMAVERGIEVQGAILRPDLIVFDRNGRPWMVVECKAPRVELSQVTVNQAVAYNRKLQAPYVLVTNGSDHRCVRMQDDGFEYVDAFPDWNDQKDT